jgi:tetratricopeptide (TPR) repeat protein
MRKFIRLMALAVLMLSTAVSATAATPSEFYATLLRRGIAAFDGERYTDAARQLRIAAFGMVEAVDQYQIAQVYLTLTYDKLGENDKARDAARRVVVAERVERRWSSVALPVAVRTAFDKQAAKLLTAAEQATLRGIAPPAPAPTQTATQTPPPAIVPPPAAAQEKTPVVATKPPVVVTTPAKPVTQTPAPQTVTATPPRTEPPKTTPVKTTQPQKPATTQQGTNGRTAAPVQKPATPAPAPAPTPRTFSSGEIATRLVAAERALNTANLLDARRVYRELLAGANLPHETLIRIAEGLYRSRDFSAALQAFTRAGALRKGEEPYRYYVAVAAYETGDTARAKKELAAALPFIEMTPDVTRYRAKIEGAL